MLQITRGKMMEELLLETQQFSSLRIINEYPHVEIKCMFETNDGALGENNMPSTKLSRGCSIICLCKLNKERNWGNLAISIEDENFKLVSGPCMTDMDSQHAPYSLVLLVKPKRKAQKLSLLAHAQMKAPDYELEMTMEFGLSLNMKGKKCLWSIPTNRNMFTNTCVCSNMLI